MSILAVLVARRFFGGPGGPWTNQDILSVYYCASVWVVKGVRLVWPMVAS